MSGLLSQSKILRNWDLFSPKMRYPNDIFLMHMVCRAFLPKRVLEIGFCQGQTLGVLIDACGPDTDFVSVDIDFSKNKNFNSLYGSNQSRITWICEDSSSLTYKGQFDLMVIDGDHSYESAHKDLEQVLKVSHPGTILVMDDYDWHTISNRGVKGVIHDNLLGQRDWVPFMMGDQTMFFHHVSHATDSFLDHDIQNTAKNFICFSNVLYNNHCVLQSKTPNIFKDHIDLFCLALERYGI